MTDRVLTRLLRSVAVAGAVLPAAAMIERVVRLGLDFETLIAFVPIAFAGVLWIAAGSQPRNSVLWFLALFIIGVASVIAWPFIGSVLVPDANLTDEGFTFEDLGTGLLWIQALTVALATAGFFGLMTFGLLLFPDGTLPSRRWRWVATVIGVSIVLQVIDTFMKELGAPWIAEDSAWYVLGLIFVAAPFISLGSLFVRYRSGGPIDRTRIKWILGGASVFVPLTIVGFVFEQDLPVLVGGLVFVASYGIAIVRYNLFDIDLVINRAIVFGLLAAFITAVYAVVVGTIGSLIGGSDIALAIGATTIVAMAFEPVRVAAQRLADRLVYGRRAAPYEVLSDLTRSLPNAEEESGLLDRMATQLLAGTGAERAQVWLADGDTLTLAASEPAAPPIAAQRLEDLDGAIVPIEHDGELLGALTIEPGNGSPLRSTELRLAEDLAGSASLVVRKLRLDVQLERTATDLASSRRRLVEAQDTERRRLERQLQEGSIQDVLGLKVALVLAERTARDEGSERTADLLSALATEAQAAIDEIHGLASGLYPAILESEGLDAAVSAMAASAPIAVTVAGGIGRFPSEIEIAAFYCISEAMTNALKHASPPIAISLADTGSSLRFTVSDSGPGFDPTTTRPGSGLYNMHDRLDTVAGKLVVTSAPGEPTTITGTIPTPGDPAVRQASAAARESGPKSDFEMNATAPASSAARS